MTFASHEIAEKFASYPEGTRQQLLRLRDLILDVAASDPRIGPLDESLKWGQPAYRPKRARVGTTLRLDARGDDTISLFYHCQSKLGEQIDALYGNVLTMDNRSVSISIARPPEPDVLRHCIQMALTYHVRNEPAGRRSYCAYGMKSGSSGLMTTVPARGLLRTPRHCLLRSKVTVASRNVPGKGICRRSVSFGAAHSSKLRFMTMRSCIISCQRKLIQLTQSSNTSSQ